MTINIEMVMKTIMLMMATMIKMNMMFMMINMMRMGMSLMSLQIDWLNIVGWEHAGLSCPVNSPRHPALVYEDGINDDISVSEGNLVRVLGVVVVHRLIAPHAWSLRLLGWLLLIRLLLRRCSVTLLTPGVAIVHVLLAAGCLVLLLTEMLVLLLLL